jgi:hypothetical protein
MLRSDQRSQIKYQQLRPNRVMGLHDAAFNPLAIDAGRTGLPWIIYDRSVMSTNQGEKVNQYDLYEHNLCLPFQILMVHLIYTTTNLID